MENGQKDLRYFNEENIQMANKHIKNVQYNYPLWKCKLKSQ